MKLRALIMLRIGREVVKPGDTFESPKSQALLLIKNKLATVLKKCEQDDDGIEDNSSQNEEEDYSSLTVNELKEELKQREIEIPKGAKKDDLIALLEANDEESEENGANDEDNDAENEGDDV